MDGTKILVVKSKFYCSDLYQLILVVNNGVGMLMLCTHILFQLILCIVQTLMSARKMRRLTAVPTLNATTQLEATRACASMDMKRMNMDNAKVCFTCNHTLCDCQKKLSERETNFFLLSLLLLNVNIKLDLYEPIWT